MADTEQDLEERIRVRAYHLWLADGCPPGREQDYWERAKELQAIVDNPSAGQRPNPMAQHHGEVPPTEEPVEEAEIQENYGEFPERFTDQGDRSHSPQVKKQRKGPTAR
jgi:hypothetical protein